MKVGTDGVLIGAWSEINENTQKILDIGCGSGLIAIMLAQKCRAHIIGIDIDESAVVQAHQNAQSTAWSERLFFKHENAITFKSNELFDLIVCNPPFFANSLQGPDYRRNNARHNSSLPITSLIDTAHNLLNHNGLFNLILPFDLTDEFILKSWERGLNLHKKCVVYTKYGAAPKRSLLSLSKCSGKYPKTDTLYIMDGDGGYTDDFKNLTKDFYLNF